MCTFYYIVETVGIMCIVHSLSHFGTGGHYVHILSHSSKGGHYVNIWSHSSAHCITLQKRWALCAHFIIAEKVGIMCTFYHFEEHVAILCTFFLKVGNGITVCAHFIKLYIEKVGIMWKFITLYSWKRGHYVQILSHSKGGHYFFLYLLCRFGGNWADGLMLINPGQYFTVFLTLGLLFYDPNYLLSYLVVAILIFLAI